MPNNDPKVKILEVKDNSFDIYEYYLEEIEQRLMKSYLKQ